MLPCCRRLGTATGSQPGPRSHRPAGSPIDTVSGPHWPQSATSNQVRNALTVDCALRWEVFVAVLGKHGVLTGDKTRLKFGRDMSELSNTEAQSNEVWDFLRLQKLKECPSNRR